MALSKEKEEMRKERLRVILMSLLAFMAGLIGLSAEYSAASPPEKCGSNQSRRISIGPEKILSQLHKNAETSLNPPFFPLGQFHEEEFKHVGKIKVSGKTTFELVLLTTTWGESCRATRRLLVFGADGAYIGNYGSLPDEPSKLTGTKVQFPFDEETGSTIDFGGVKPPPEVRLDGEILNFEAAESVNAKKSSTKR